MENQETGAELDKKSGRNEFVLLETFELSVLAEI